MALLNPTGEALEGVAPEGVPVETPQVLLEHYLKTLRLPSFSREYDKVAGQCAQERLDYPRYLLRLCELEVLDRERRAMERRIRSARFPVTKSLDSFDFTVIPALNKALVLELARCDYISRKENVLRLPFGQGELRDRQDAHRVGSGLGSLPERLWRALCDCRFIGA